MILPRLQKYLDEHKIKYQVLTHSTAYTAQEVQETQAAVGGEVVVIDGAQKSGSSMFWRRYSSAWE